MVSISRPQTQRTLTSPDHRFFSCQAPPRFFAHRGASGEFPENTLEAFSRAVERGVRYLELDVWSSKDGKVVVIHDESVDRTTDGRGSVRDLTLKELKGLDAGYWFRLRGQGSYPFRGKGIRIPTLEEVLRAFPDVMLNIEVKQRFPPMEELLWEMLSRNDSLDRVLIASRYHEVILRVRAKFRGSVPTSASRKEGWMFAKWYARGKKGALFTDAKALQIPEKWMGVDYITRGFIEAAHHLGLEVHVWTVNHKRRIERFLRLGVDGIMGDYPEMFPMKREMDRN